MKGDIELSNRIELNDQEMENVSGGILLWQGGVVTVYKGDPNVKYSYTDYDACQEWLVTNWKEVQTEACLEALQAAGLVQRI